MFEFSTEKDLMSNNNQSVFKQGILCINQLYSITRGIYQSFQDNLGVKAIFLDIYTAFHNVCHKCLTYRLKKSSISGKALNTAIDFLCSENNGLFYMGKFLHGIVLKQCYLRGLYFGSYYFFIYINDLSDNLSEKY